MGQYDHYPDMNHDGKKDLYDCSAFHNMMDEEERAASQNSHRRFVVTRTSWTWKDYIYRIIAVLILVTPADLLLKGTIPCNGLTLVIGLGMLIGGIVLAFDIFEML